MKMNKIKSGLWRKGRGSTAGEGWQRNEVNLYTNLRRWLQYLRPQQNVFANFLFSNCYLMTTMNTYLWFTSPEAAVILKNSSKSTCTPKYSTYKPWEEAQMNKWRDIKVLSALQGATGYKVQHQQMIFFWTYVICMALRTIRRIKWGKRVRDKSVWLYWLCSQ